MDCVWAVGVATRASAMKRALFRLHTLVWGRYGVGKCGGLMEGAGDGGKCDVNKF